MVWDIQVLRDIDHQIAEAMRRSDVRYMEIQYHIRSVEARIGALSKRMSMLEEKAKPPTALDIKAVVSSLWFRAAVLLALLYANISVEQSTKLISLLR